MPTRYFMVRAQAQDDASFELLQRESVVAVGWSDIDFSRCDDADQVRQRVREQYPTERTRAVNDAGSFKSIREGDKVLVPHGRSVWLAEAGVGEQFSPQAVGLNLANQRRVQFVLDGPVILDVPRAGLSEGLQRRLRVPGSAVADLGEFAVEINALFVEDGRDRRVRLDRFREECKSALKRRLLENICGGRTGLQAGGYGLERLICDLLRADGYTAAILPRNQFAAGADADIVATRSDAIVETKVLIQVKHHQGTTDEQAAQQLLGAKRQGYSDYVGCVVTSAQASCALRRLCEDNGIVVIEGDDLADWIFDSCNRLSAETKATLGFVEIPQLWDGDVAQG